MYIHERSNGQVFDLESGLVSNASAMTAAGTGIDTLAPFCSTAGQSARDSLNETIYLSGTHGLTAGQNVSIVSRLTTPDDYTNSDTAIKIEFTGWAMADCSLACSVLPFVTTIENAWSFSSNWAAAVKTNPIHILSHNYNNALGHPYQSQWKDLLVLNKGTDWHTQQLYVGVMIMSYAAPSVTDIHACYSARYAIERISTFEKGFG